MTIPASKCPDHNQVAGYAVGKLSTEVFDSIGPHIESCSTCQASLDTMEDEDDSVLMAVRHVKTIQDADDSELEDLLPSVDGILADCVDGTSPRTSSDGSGDADRLPEQIGQYRIIERVGRGGMGTVYKALHTKLKRHVALKVVVSRRLSDPATIARFHREMEAVGRLDHPNIVRAHDAGECDGRHFLITELLDGVNLSQLVRRHGPLSVSDACEAVREAAIGLEYAHAHGLIHRDVKPSNLMLTAGGAVKILDMGLARLSDPVSDEPESVGATGDDDPDDDHATAADQILGSPAFMAPEQITDSRDVDGRADVFALGGTLFFLLTGETPFSRTKKDLLRNRRDEPDQIVSRLSSDVPPQLISLLTRMLSCDPDDRPSDMAEVVKGLEGWARRGDLESVARKVVDSDPEVARHSSHRKSTSSSWRRRSWIAAGILAAASMAAWNWQAMRPPAPRPVMPSAPTPTPTPAVRRPPATSPMTTKGEVNPYTGPPGGVNSPEAIAARAAQKARSIARNTRPHTDAAATARVNPYTGPPGGVNSPEAIAARAAQKARSIARKQ